MGISQNYIARGRLAGTVSIAVGLLAVGGCASSQAPSASSISAPGASVVSSSTVASPTPSPSVNGAPPAPDYLLEYPPSKASVLARADQERLKGSGKPIVPASFAPISGSLVSGIFTPGQDPQLRDQFFATNAWAGAGLGAWEAVEAGSIPAQTGEGLTDHQNDQAAVFVYTQPTDPNSSTPRTVFGIYRPTGVPIGQFTIEKVQGTKVTLALSSSTVQYVFDSSSLTFVAPNAAP